MRAKGYCILNDLAKKYLRKRLSICFVHGLNGGSVSTWKKGEVFWPYNLLAKNIPEARIITWGYDANVAHFLSPTSANRVKDHAKGLSNDLGGLRSSPETSTRPIIFIAHSLGGIVCAQVGRNVSIPALLISLLTVIEQSLLQSSSIEPDDVERLSDHTAALTFMGTPFEGSKTAGWASLFERLSGLTHIGKINQTLLDHLQSDSHDLKTLGEDFPKWLNSRRSAGKKRVRVVCFFEELPSQLAGHIVPRASAELPGEDTLSLHGDHVGICKFENDKDPKYRIVLDKLSKWVEEIKMASSAGKPEAIGFNPQASFTMGKNYGGIQTGQDVSSNKQGSHVSNQFVSLDPRLK
ncbi:MAG: hypothetical protein Q9224_003668 [Gallowayella concinna]